VRTARSALFSETLQNRLTPSGATRPAGSGRRTSCAATRVAEVARRESAGAPSQIRTCAATAAHAALDGRPLQVPRRAHRVAEPAGSVRRRTSGAANGVALRPCVAARRRVTNRHCAVSNQRPRRLDDARRPDRRLRLRDAPSAGCGGQRGLGPAPNGSRCDARGRAGAARIRRCAASNQSVRRQRTGAVRRRTVLHRDCGCVRGGVRSSCSRGGRTRPCRRHAGPRWPTTTRARLGER